MKRSICHAAGALVAACLAAAGTDRCFGQVESINPNPLQPQGVGGGSSIGTYRSGASNGGQSGLRSTSPGDNPAGLMLRELNRPEYDQDRGSVRIRGASVDAARRAYRLSHQRQQLLEGAVYFGSPGEYEDAIYRPLRGSYRYTARTTRTRSYRSGN